MVNRRQFLQASSSAVLAAELAAYADTPIPMAKLGKTGLKVTRITLGGAHMRFGTEENALKIIRRALDLGINFFDSALKIIRRALTIRVISLLALVLAAVLLWFCVELFQPF